jgi:uncharacterized cupin superfamily protein
VVGDEDNSVLEVRPDDNVILSDGVNCISGRKEKIYKTFLMMLFTN